MDMFHIWSSTGVGVFPIRIQTLLSSSTNKHFSVNLQASFENPSISIRILDTGFTTGEKHSTL